MFHGFCSDDRDFHGLRNIRVRVKSGFRVQVCVVG